MKKSFKTLMAENWLVLLFALQPVLDAVAFWNQNSVATVAGYIRLVIMIALPLCLLIALKKKKRFIIAMGVIALYCALHVLNCFRVGYISVFTDVAYLARVAQMPILAVCFIFCMRDEGVKRQGMRAFTAAGMITVLLLAVALATGTWNSTYGGGTGISGWVIDDNRCANSIIFVTLSVFAVNVAAGSDKKLLNILLPAFVAFLLLANGTKACYVGLFAITCGYVFFMLARWIITRERIKAVFAVTLVLLTVASVLVYPLTPRAKVDESQRSAALKTQDELDAKLAALGYDLSAMTLEEKLADPVLYAVFEEYYKNTVGYVLPDMFTRFGTEKVLRKYGMTTSAATLIDVRVMKTTYASLVWDECDTLTKLVGFEATQVCQFEGHDMENDWPALFYYYGYIGFALYVGFVLYFILLVLRRLIKDLKGSFTTENFTLLLCLLLQLGLAQFSGAILRRPNVSIYMSLVLALIYYKTAVLPIKGESRNEAQCDSPGIQC